MDNTVELRSLNDADFKTITEDLVKTIKNELKIKESGEQLDFEYDINKYLARYEALGFSTLINRISSRDFHPSDSNVILNILGSIHNKYIDDIRLQSFLWLLEDASPNIRDGAIMGLVEIGRVESIEPIRVALKNEDDEFIRYLMTTAISKITKKNKEILEAPMENKKKLLERMPPVESDGYVVPVKLQPGTVNLYEYATIQAVMEQLVRIIHNNTGPFDGVGAKAEIALDFNRMGDPKSAEITINIRYDRNIDFYVRPVDEQKKESSLSDNDIAKSIAYTETEVY